MHEAPRTAQRRLIDVEDTLPLLQTLPLSVQHLMAMFGATVLVPLLFRVDPAICLLMNGIGTLIYSLVTKGRVPAYLGSSFAFIAPTLLVMTPFGDNVQAGFARAQGGFIVFGLFFIVVSLIVRRIGVGWLQVLFPPAVMGAVVAVIGLELAPVACEMAGLIATPHTSANALPISMFTLTVGVVGSLVFRGFLSIIPVLVAVVSGYVLALAMGAVDFSAVQQAAWIRVPSFSAPVFDVKAILIIAPAYMVVLAEHIGHLVVTGNIVGRDLVANPGLHTSLLGDGISNFISGFTGSPPNTTYGENIGVMAITRVYSVWVIRVAAVVAIVCSLLGKLSALIRTIPVPVMGGICILLFGVIAVAGVRILIEQKVDYSRNVSMVLSSVVFVLGVSGAKLQLGSVELKGMALSACAGLVLALLVHGLERCGLLNETAAAQVSPEPPPHPLP